MPFDQEALLRHRDFVRAVAGSLLHDPHLVDDVEQETWATALGRPPRKPGALGAWLGKVARHLAFRQLRSRERRGRREQASSPPRPLTSPDEMARNLETQQRVVAAVLRLDRLHRETILLRFYEGLPPREAAARLGVPVNTVRTRTRRALELLRADLQREDRRAWFVGLLPLVAPRRVALGALLMKAKVAAVAAVLVLAGAAAWQLAPRPETPRAEPARAIAEAPPAAPRTCRLAGRVTDGAGAPVAGARVELRDLEAATDAQGAFALETEREGTEVLAASSGALKAQRAVELRHGDVSAGTLVLAETVTVTGVVLDIGGEGVSGAVVEAWACVVDHDILADDPLRWNEAPPPIAASTLSGEGGAFRLPLPRDASMVLRARKGGAMSLDEVGYDLHDDTGLVVLRLRALGAIRGRVVDLSGVPVAGASVHLVPPKSGYVFPKPEVRSVRGVRATTAADGGFTLAALPEVYGVLVTHPGFVPFHAARVLAPRDGWTIRLSPGRALEGVVEAEGRPAPGVAVRLLPTDGHAAIQEAKTDDLGQFLFAHAALEQPLHLFADGGRLGTALLRDVTWRGEPVRVALDPVRDVEGRVLLEDGTPVEGVRVYTWEFRVQTSTTVCYRGYREAVSGPDGAFKLEGASRCRAIWLHPTERRYVATGGTRIPESGEAVVRVAPVRRLTVRVEDGDGAPVAGASVYGGAFTGPDGTCRLFVPMYATELTATKPGYRGVGEIPKEGEEVRIVLRPVPVLRGIVRDAAGNPLADVRVQATYERRLSAKETYSGACGTAFTDVTGAFVLDVIDEELRVTYERIGFLAAIETFRPDGTARAVTLEKSRVLNGRVVDEEGNPIAGAAVAARRVVAWMPVTWTAADGRFTLADVEAGEMLRLTSPGYGSRDLVPTDPNAEGEQTFVLARELVIEGRVLKCDGTPAHPVNVAATSETPGVTMGAQSDAEGRFRIPALAAGKYTVSASVGYRLEGVGDLADAEWDRMAGVAAGTTGLVLRQKEPKCVAGVVTDENDRPLPGARVNLYYNGTADFAKGGTVDGEGRFRLPVRTGRYEVRVNLPGMAFRKVSGVEAGREGLVLRFEPGLEIAGRIESPEGYAPGSGAVEVSSGDFHGYAEVDRSGAFAIRGLPAGTYELTAIGAARGGGPAMRGSARAEAGASGVTIELKKIELR